MAEEKVEKKVEVLADKDSPRNHFSETDLQREWGLFLEGLKPVNILAFNAVNAFKLSKLNEDGIEISYPSESSKVEFNLIKDEFVNHFQHMVNNYHIKLSFKIDIKLKKEILTKRKIFDKFAEQNPLLNDLNDLMKFDFS